MLGTTVIIPTALVPQMGGGNDEKAQVIQTLLFVAGLNTLLQTLFGTRLQGLLVFLKELMFSGKLSYLALKCLRFF
ncbi:nucleobase-ascorbate transporter 6-like [Phoenix dactylifera]|uniref:Nucleobase-ascorbate transporter 6-like n=1 Tax=Phoenix dactylifera TaxID=42345 RepID=A0A8B9ARE1_PHODC|nr:nucleobase-ascorbate transporter 6-like [Phoenix dactylifera]